MSRLQKLLLALLLASVIAMCLFPPWSYTTRVAGTEIVTFVGYRFFFTPPSMPNPRYTCGQIELARLLLQIIAVSSAFGIPIVLAGRRRPKVS